MIIIVIVLSAIFLVFYFITNLVVKPVEQVNNTNNITEIDSNAITLNNLLNRKESEYYVLTIKESLYDSSYNKINYTEIYNGYIDNYGKTENALPFYRVNLDDALNKSYLDKELNITEDLSNLKLNDEVLFTFQKDILSGNLQNSEVLRDPDKMMRLVVPLFVNSFLTYNFRDKGHFLEVHQELENEGNQEDLQMLNLFYSNGTQDDFISKVESHNGLTNRDKVFAHFRNSVVHNNFECKNGEIRIRDYDRDGNQTADFKIPYSMFLDFFREYSVARNINSNIGRPSKPQSGTEPSDDADDGR